MTELETAARALLDAHDFLRHVDGGEPPENQERRWLAWHDRERRPAHDAWLAAVIRFRELQPAPDGWGTGHHPWAFRPECKAILGLPLVPGVDGPEEDWPIHVA
jgi:hypothetical protein